MSTRLPNWTWWLLGAVLVVGLSVALIYVAWELEESRKAVRTVVVESPDEDAIFVVELREREGEEFIVFCNEEHFHDAFSHFTKFVGVESEPLEAPGGPMVLALADHDLPEELQPAQRAVIEVLKRHAPDRVVLVAHSECLLYDTLAAWQDELDEVKRRQHRDLIAARNAIKRWFPETEVEIYYADKQEDRLKFLPMHPDELALPGELDRGTIDFGSEQDPD